MNDMRYRRCGDSILEPCRPGLLLMLLLTWFGPRCEAALDPAKTFAFVVGVSEYTDPQIQDLNYASNDAVRFITTLTEHLGVPRVNITALHQGPDPDDKPVSRPTMPNIRNELQSFIAARNTGDTVIFFFSGHGVVTSMGAVPRGYLAAEDCDPNSYSKTCIPLSTLSRDLQRCPAQSRICLIDACHAADGVRHAEINQVMQGVPNFYAITSCKAGEQSFESDDWEQGLFTFWLCHGLEGAADQNGDAVVSLDEVYEVVARRVPASAQQSRQQQQPAKFVAQAAPSAPAFTLTSRPYDAVVDTLAEHLNALIRQHDGPPLSVGTIEFAQDPLDAASEPVLTTEYGMFANKLARAVIDALQEENDRAFSLQSPVEVLETLVAKGPNNPQPKDLLQPQIAGIAEMPRLLIKGTFAPQLQETPGRVTVSCAIHDLQQGAKVGQVSANIEVDPELFAYLQPVIPSVQTKQAFPASHEPADIADYDRKLWEDAQRQSGPAANQAVQGGPLRIMVRRIPQGKQAAPVELLIADQAGQHLRKFGVAAGDEFSIHIGNISGEDLAVVVLVDGLDVLGLKDPAPGAQPLDRLVNDLSEAWEWLFPRGSQQSITGWMTRTRAADGTQMFNSAPFTIRDIAGAGERTSYSQRTGEIVIAVFGTKEAGNGARGDLAVVAGTDVEQRAFQINDSFVINHADLRGVYRIAYFDDAATSAPPAVPATRP